MNASINKIDSTSARPQQIQGRRIERIQYLLGHCGSRPPSRTGRQSPLSQPTLLRLFFRLGFLWGLADPEQRVLLGGASQTVFEVWRSGMWRKVPVDVQDRIEQALHIHCAMLGVWDEPGALEWLRKPNAAEVFGGGTPLQRLLAGHLYDLIAVRRHLEQLRQLGRIDPDRNLGVGSADD